MALRKLIAQPKKNAIFEKNIAMPASKNALIRYKTIDRCLRNRYRRWTLDNLIEACSDALYEFEGREENVSKRTIQLDIQMMRSEKLGYNAPIKVVDNKYYIYEDPDYSITESPLAPGDVERMEEAVKVLRQLAGFQEFAGMEDLVGRLQDRVRKTQEKTKPVIFLDKNERLKGLEFITPLHKFITEKKALDITHQGFNAQAQHTFVFHPYALKEYNNRWFLVGYRWKKTGIQSLALDRIISFKESDATYIDNPDFDPEVWFSDVIGVTKTSADKPQVIRFRATKQHAPYIKTKPLHSSQQLIEEAPDGSAVFKLNVIVNNELIRVLIGFGIGIKVLAPESVVSMIKDYLETAAAQYC